MHPRQVSILLEHEISCLLAAQGIWKKLERFQAIKYPKLMDKKTAISDLLFGRSTGGGQPGRPADHFRDTQGRPGQAFWLSVQL